MAQPLGSKWAGLSRHLLATIYPVDNAGVKAANAVEVVAPASDVQIESTANWQSTFEQSGPETRLPAVMSMLQSGAAFDIIQSLFGAPADQQTRNNNTPSGNIQAFLRDVRRQGEEFIRSFEGRTGITKLNSTQIFTGSPPIKITMTLRFRAYDDPASEVQAPCDQLWQWHLAQELAATGGFVQALADVVGGRNTTAQGFFNTLLPSRAPQMVALSYGGALFAPMVIESVGHPLSVPRTSEGEPLQATIQVTLATLTSLDANDWRRSRLGQPIATLRNSNAR